jgi:hypothetical protein
MALPCRQIVLILIVLAVLAADTALTYSNLTRPHPGHNDFMSRWEGARSYWLDGLNPYGEQASLNIQQRIYGRPIAEDEDPGYFAYPFYTVFLVYPLVHLDYAWASAVWMVLLEVCLVGAMLLTLRLFRWRPSPIVLAFLLLWSLVSYYPARALLLGQPGVLVVFLEIFTLWALAQGHDRAAGLALALSTIKPQMGYLLIPFLLLWGLRTKRWNFVAAFAITFAALLALSFILLPSWISDWLAQVRVYDTYTALGSPVWIVTRYYLGALNGTLGALTELILTAVCYLLMLWAWFTVLVQNRHERFLWAVVLTLTVTHLVAPRTATPHYVIFILPMIFYFKHITQMNRRRGTLYVILILLALLVGQWLHFLLTVSGQFEHPTVYLPVPFGVLALLLLTRDLWWRAALVERSTNAVPSPAGVQA